MHEAILTAEAEVQVSPAAARDWFLSLADHPERYTFESHQGFEFVQGRFGEVGAQFRTREQFFLFRMDLLFELTEVRKEAFFFRLVRPVPLGVWGGFEIESGGEGHTRLVLRIGSNTRAGQLLLRCYPVAVAIHRQIAAEVSHIGRSMERTYSRRRAPTEDDQKRT